jgi:lipopolysaccharide export LptBFGC system permease protein LptF
VNEKRYLVDNNTFNVLTALQSLLEAHAAYLTYAKDGNSQLWNQLAQQTQQSVQLLQAELQKTMSDPSYTMTMGQGQGQQGMSGNYGATQSQSGQMR